MDGRETDDDDTLERHTDTNKLTRHSASWAATHPEWTYSLGAPLRNPCVKKRGPDLARRQAKKNTEPRRV